MLAKYDALNPVALKSLLGGGQARLQAFSPAIMEASLKASLEVYAEVSAQNEDFKKIWEALLAFRNDQYLWWRVCEYTYDDFLIRNRTRTSSARSATHEATQSGGCAPPSFFHR